MFGMNNQNIDNETIRTPPSDDAFAIVTTLFSNKRFNNHEITVNSLSLTILELIKQNQIKCEINWDETHTVGKKLTEKDLEVMKNITLRIANKGELKTSQTLAINLLKTMNKNKKFNLKDMLKQSKNPAIANKFEEDYHGFKKAIESENNYTSKDYKNILVDGKFTDEGKNLKKEWENFKEYLASEELSKKYPPKSNEENSSQLIYAACFNIEKETLKSRENNNIISEFIDKDGYKLLNIIINNTISNVSEKRKGDGIFYGVNDKYTIPGGG